MTILFLKDCIERVEIDGKEIDAWCLFAFHEQVYCDRVL
jgi:hypothetical protein